jgi:hypothetical protein
MVNACVAPKHNMQFNKQMKYNMTSCPCDGRSRCGNFLKNLSLYTSAQKCTHTEGQHSEGKCMQWLQDANEWKIRLLF